jgi:hypothetical protein
MTETVKSLWPPQIRPNILSPMTILQAQAVALLQQTGGVLSADIKRREEGDKLILTFDIVVPALDGYRHRVLVLAHGRDMAYPAVVDAEVFRPTGLASVREFIEAQQAPLLGVTKKPVNRADSDQELVDLVGKVLQSPHVLSAAQSLIARASEALAAKGSVVSPPGAGNGREGETA